MSDSAQVTISGKLIIGLTGNIATGKSAVSRLAGEHEALVIDADKIVHELMDKDSHLQAALAVAFGSEVRKTNGKIDRRVLGKIVFADAEALKDLEAMTHPAVRLEVGRRIQEASESVIMVEAIKLLEGELSRWCHQIWVTRCSKQRQFERLVVCRGMDKESATTRINAQPSQEEKVAVADVVIETDGVMAETEAQFERAWSRLPDVATAESKTVWVPAPKTAVSPPPAMETESKPREVKRLTRESAKLIKLPPRSAGAATTPASQPEVAKPRPAPPPPEEKATDRPADLQVRRARPSDVPSILLLIQRATEGAVRIKRSDLLAAMSERSYFIGQKEMDVRVIVGMNIDYQVARMDQIYMHPMDEVTLAVGTAVLEDIERSAKMHIAELMVAFLSHTTTDAMRHLFASQGYQQTEKNSLPRAWQLAIEESQPADTYLMTKILKDERLAGS